MSSTRRTIPFLNLKKQYHAIENEIALAIRKVGEVGFFSEGPEIVDFEDKFAKLQRVSHCISLNSGTSSLISILLGHEISCGDEVIIPANTCFPTAEAVCLAGATPVFVDCEEQYFNINPDHINNVITAKTKAIIAVHLYGHPAQLGAIKEITDHKQVSLIEDCAQAHCAKYNEHYVGNFGIAGAFSFYPTKNLGAYGEAGAVITNNEALAAKIQALKNHGSTQKNIHDFIGNNYRMDSLQAAILSVKLKYLNKWTKLRQKNAIQYLTRLVGVGDLILPEAHHKVEHVYHQFVIRTDSRDGLQKYLREHGIQTAIHYPLPCHLQPALSHLGYARGDFPISEKMCKQVLSLPVAEHVTQKDINYISDCIGKFFGD